MLDVGIELEELRDVDAELDLGPELARLVDKRRPVRRELGVVLLEIRLVPELEADDDVLIAVVDDV